MPKLMVGGQAVIEGVMMRGPGYTATAVRDPDGVIQVEKKPVHSISDRFPILKKPMLRGTVSLIESLVIGIRSLSYSAKMAGEEDEQLSLRSCSRVCCLLPFRRAQRSSSILSRRIRSF